MIWGFSYSPVGPSVATEKKTDIDDDVSNCMIEYVDLMVVSPPEKSIGDALFYV